MTNKFTFLCQTRKSMTTKHWYISLYHRVPERDTKLIFLFLFLAFLWSCSDSLTPVAGYGNYKNSFGWFWKEKKLQFPPQLFSTPQAYTQSWFKNFVTIVDVIWVISSYLLKINFHGINNNNRRSFLWLKSNQKGITSLFGFCFLE